MSKKSLILVILQFLIMGIFLFLGSFQRNPLLLSIQFFALFIALWGIYVMKKFNIQPEVKQHAKLNKKGTYQIIRNPMYFGIIVFFGIAVIENFSYLRLILFIILTIVLLLKIFMEEKFLTDKFGKTYTEYKLKTYCLFPFLF